MLPTQASRRLTPRTAATSATKALTIATAVLLFAGLVSAGVVGDEPAAHVAAKDSTVVNAEGTTDAGAATGAEPGAPASDSSAVDPVTGGPIAATSGSATPSGAGAGKAPSASAGKGATVNAPGSASTGGGGAAPSSSPTAGPAAATASGPLTASDVGVTADSIKIGVLIPNLNELAQAGFRVGVPGDHRKIAEAWAKDLNDRGGIFGRKVKFVYDVFSVFDVDDMTRACKKMTEDEKVFTVINLGGYDSVAQLCIAKEHKTPLIAGDPQPADWYTDSAPYLWTPLMNKDRMHRNHMRYLKESGTLQKGRDVVGVIYHGIPNVGVSVEKSLLPELRSNDGIEPKVVVKLSDDSNQAVNQINSAVLQMNREGVTNVIMPMNLIFKAQFMNTAEGQNFFPKYTDSDHYFGCYDFTTSAYPEKSFNRMTCITASNSGIKDPFNNPLANPTYQRAADEVYKNKYPASYAEGCSDDQDCMDAQRALNYAFGTNFLMWKEAAERVGTNLTRSAWGGQMGKTGNWTRCVTSPSLSHSSTKFDGPDGLAVVQWFAEAGDSFKARRFRQVKPQFPAYY